MSISRLMQMGAAGAGGPTGLESSTYDGISFDATGNQISNAEGFVFNPTGTKLLVGSAVSSQIVEFNLSSGFNLGSASYSLTRYLSSQTITGRGLAFNDTGTNLFYVDQSADKVDAYNISNYSVSSFNFSGTFLDASSQTTAANGVTFNPTGSKAYVCGVSNQVFVYNLSSGFALNTATYDSAFNLTDVSYATNMKFNLDGTRFYVVDQVFNRIVEYILTTPYDLATATHNYTLAASTFGISGTRDLFFNQDNTKMFVLRRTSCTIFQFSFTPPD